MIFFSYWLIGVMVGMLIVSLAALFTDNYKPRR